MQELGVDEVYIDRMSGKDANRPELMRMMDFVRQGDTVIVESISRFARNTRDLLDLIERLNEKSVAFVSKKESFMRDLLEKALNKGLGVSFTVEGGFTVIRITKGADVVASCSLGSADFRASVEDSLQSLLLDLDRKGI